MVGEMDMDESLYNLTLQIDESKKLISTVISYLYTLKKLTNEFLPSIKYSEEQWELDINVSK